MTVKGSSFALPGKNGKDGAVGPAGAKGDTGAASTIPGPTGPAGKDGASSAVPGPAGAAGQRGSVWTSGSGSPIGTATAGDQYLDTTTGDVWQFS